VQSAVQDCDETNVEIDLTKFIKAVCSHLKEFWLSRKLDLFKMTKGCSEQFNLRLLEQLDSCARLKARHGQIKEQFSAILAEYFRAVPSNMRFFFSIPKWEREQQVCYYIFFPSFLMLTKFPQQVDNVGTENENLADIEDANSNYSHEFNSRRGL